MKKLTFNYFASFGKDDHSDVTQGSVEIPDNTWEKMKTFRDQNPDSFALDEKQFQNVYLQCYEAVVDQEAKTCLSDDAESILGYLEEARKTFDRDTYTPTLEDAREYLENTISFTIMESFPE